MGSGSDHGPAADRYHDGVSSGSADLAGVKNRRLNLPHPLLISLGRIKILWGGPRAQRPVGPALTRASAPHSRCSYVTLCSVLSLAGALTAGEMPSKIQKLLDEATEIQRGFLGVDIVDVASGETLFEANSDRLFVPASNSKLFTTALGLVQLGPDWRFHTTVIAGRAPDGEGRIAGPVTLVGGGDPNLSGRELPYRVDSPPGDGLQAVEDLASQVVARGVRRIDGDIVGDDTVYLWEPYPDGWDLGDAMWEYGAPVSALTINDNGFR